MTAHPSIHALRGTRYGDFSRPFGTHPGYNGLLIQQGRVLLDSDHNNHAAAAARQLRVALHDLFGGSAAPATAPGYALRPRMALAFDGRDRLVIDEWGDLAPGAGEQHTLELWLSWGGKPGVLAECRDEGDELRYRIDIGADGRPALHVHHRGGQAVADGAEPLRERWPAQMAAVISNDFAALYVDGRQVALVAHSGLHERAGSVIVLGGPAGDHDRQHGFTGLVSGARAWRRALPAARLAATTPAPVEVDGDPDLMASWRLDATGAALSDAVSGRTAHTRGERPRWRLMDLVIGPGRFYVEGVLSELPEEQVYSRQLGAEPLPDEGQHVAYLEIWEESVSWLQDPGLAEVELGGLDTSVWTRVAGAVRLAPLDLAPDPGDHRALVHAVSAGRSPAGPTLAAEHVGDRSPGSHLYRVEIHDSGQLGGEGRRPTFKWSRDNGSSLFVVAGADEDRCTVDLLPPAGSTEPLAPGDVVEPLCGPDVVLGEQFPLLVVLDANTEGDRVTLNAPLPARALQLRRWDHGGGERRSAREGAALPVRPGPIELEDGIRISFGNGHYRRHDYWWITSRMDLGSIEWPSHHGAPVPLPPSGVDRLVAPLALLTFEDEWVSVEDVRRIVTAVVEERPRRQPSPAPPEPPPEPEVREPAEPEPVPEPRWTYVGEVDVDPEDVHAAVSAAGVILLLTHEHLLAVEPDTGRVTVVAALPEHGRGRRLCVLDETVLLVGDTRYTHAYDLAGGQWSERRPLPAPRADPAVTAIDGRAHVLGGHSERLLRHRVHGEHHVYDPRTDDWQEAPPLPTHRAGAMAVRVGHLLYVVGGHGGARSHVHAEHEAYDVRTRDWRAERPVPGGHHVLGACAHRQGHLVLLGHRDAGTLHTAVVYEAAVREWVDIGVPPGMVAHAHAVDHGGRAHAIGRGERGGTVLHRRD